MRRIVMALLGAVLVAPAPAKAGLVAGLGSGVVATGGEVAAGRQMADYADRMVPVRVDVGWRFAGRYTLAAFGDLNTGLVSGPFKQACDLTENSCSADQLRFGAAARFNFLPASRLDPWVGLGVARETLRIESYGFTTTILNSRGLAVDVAAGLDWRPGDLLVISPLVQYSRGTYTEGKVDEPTHGGWETIPSAERGAHTQITVGIRVGLDFGGMPPRRP